MKKSYFLVSALMLAAAASHAQGTELFFSEYDEGAHQSGVSYNGGISNSTGSERALEIFNPTVSPVNLNAYSVRRYSNGATTRTEEERLLRTTGSNVLNSTAAFVFASGEATITAITSKADQLSAGHSPTTGPAVLFGGGVAYFNGDDAVALVRWTSGTAGTGTPVIVDLIGVIGEQPLLQSCSPTSTGNWSGTNPADGTPAVFVASANQSIIRRPSVSKGVRTNPTPQNVPGSCPPVRATGGYNIADEWLMYSTAFSGPGGTSAPGDQSYARLGEHNDYNGPYGPYLPLSTLAKFDAAINIYPNPASGTATVEIKGEKVRSITVLNNLGQTISAQPRGLDSETIKLDISHLAPGLYFVQCLSADGQLKIYKELLVK